MGERREVEMYGFPGVSSCKKFLECFVNRQLFWNIMYLW